MQLVPLLCCLFVFGIVVGLGWRYLNHNLKNFFEPMLYYLGMIAAILISVFAALGLVFAVLNGNIVGAIVCAVACAVLMVALTIITIASLFCGKNV